MEIKGIDVSKYQGAIDWNKVKAAGIQFAMIRSSYGAAFDRNFKANLAGVKAAGIPFGIYHFTVAVTPAEAEDEIDWLIDQLKGEQIPYPVAFDIEDEGSRYTGKTKQELTDITVAGMARIEHHGYYTTLYTNPNWLTSRLLPEQLNKYDIWLAAWGSKRPTSYTHGIWQYSSTGKVDGISGNVDMDKAYKDYPAIIKAAGLNGYGKADPAPEPTPKPEPTPGYSEYTVKPNDSWWGIAQAEMGNGSRCGELAAYNGATLDTVIYPRQVIKIPTGGTTIPEKSKDVTYTIKTGETLSGIAAKFGTTYQALAAYNGIRNANLIYPGQVIRIPQ